MEGNLNDCETFEDMCEISMKLVKNRKKQIYCVAYVVFERFKKQLYFGQPENYSVILFQSEKD